MGRIAVLATACLVLGEGLVPSPVGAATVAIYSNRNRDVVTIHGTTLLDADTATAWHVLTAYGSYTDFIPDLRMSRVLSRRGDTVTVEQEGDIELWVFRFPIDVTFEIREDSPSSLQSRAIAGTLPSFTSTYTLTSVPPRVRLDYVGRVETGFQLFGDMEQSAIDQSGLRHFQALADEIERQAALAHSN